MQQLVVSPTVVTPFTETVSVSMGMKRSTSLINTSTVECLKFKPFHIFLIVSYIFPYCSFGKMVACFRYASINIFAVSLPPAKLEFNCENQDWLQKESKEVTSFLIEYLYIINKGRWSLILLICRGFYTIGD